MVILNQFIGLNPHGKVMNNFYFILYHSMVITPNIAGIHILDHFRVNKKQS
jgi:hypothetical protein